MPKLGAYGTVIALIASTALTVAPAHAGHRHAKSKPASKIETKRKLLHGTSPAAPDHNETPKASMPYAKTDTMRAFTNAMGDTVYQIVASQSDLSPALSEMAARRPAFKVEEEEEFEAPENPILPAFRRITSGVPDPVVQPPQFEIESSGGPAPLAPSTGFNFAGVASNGLSPSDTNGSVGTTQYVQTVNTRYQVWNLNRTTHVATSQLGPININTLWSAFGGPCETQNSGDPIVVYDKVANRWLISQFTTGLSGGSYFQCVALSKTPDATGQYWRYAFAVPNGVFGDYPHFGVWSDAYYMMAHGFQSTSGGYVAGIFAAMDRTKMLAGDPTATWQVIFDPTEGGHMPADLDGFAPPPAGAPGIFLSLHESSMVFYRMKVDFVTPANTVKTVQADLPIAPFSIACGGGSCIPQPMGTNVGSLADRLMFRAAYRKYIDHESIVVSHSVDPSVSGLVSGVRWYDFRMSGNPDATCATFPCVRQQGTVADVAGGRSRWMPSIAMDTAENMLVGYSTTGKTNGTENHTIRYTSRAKNDPTGIMTGPEQTIATGTANNSNSRWGDYTSMSIDPADDCTFWYVNQYFTTTGQWSTRIASSSFPSGTSPGQCPASVCTTRPSGAPTIGSATIPSDNKIQVTWSALVPTPGAYAIERADGACGSGALFKPLAGVSGPTTTFTDTTVLGGLTYSYRVLAATDGQGKCQALAASGCVSATATGTCNLRPTFAGAVSGSSANQASCGVTVSWSPASAACPLTPTMKYNIFRGTTPDFVPSVANRIATCVDGPTSYLDTNNLQSGTTYFYVVRAEDNSTGNGGECGGGNEEANGVTVAGTAYGSGTQASPGTWFDGGGDGSAFLTMNVNGPGDVAGQIWRYVKTANDAGANHTPGGAYAYRNTGPGPTATYLPNQCAEIQAPPLTAGASSLALQYWERHQLEYHWDGVAVEYAVNGGPWTDVPPPSNSPAAGCDPADTTSGWENFACTGVPPVNGCVYDPSKTGYNGPLGGGTSCSDFATGGSVTAYAHRCHPITGLTPGDSIQVRWRFSSDPAAEFAGFYLDDVAVTNVRLPNACSHDTCTGQPDGTSCSDGNACTAGDTCNGGSCHSGPTAPAPGEVTGVTVVNVPGTSVTWNDAGGGAFYDVASQTLSDLRTNGTSTASCFANDVAGTSVPDGRPDPVAGDGYYYLVRAQTACATGTYGSDSASVERSPSSACP